MSCKTGSSKDPVSRTLYPVFPVLSLQPPVPLVGLIRGHHHQHVYFLFSLMDPVKCGIAMADLETVDVLPSVDRELFPVAPGSRIGIPGKDRDLLLHDPLAFWRKVFDELVGPPVQQDPPGHGVNSTKSASASIRSMSSRNRFFFSCSTITARSSS